MRKKSIIMFTLSAAAFATSVYALVAAAAYHPEQNTTAPVTVSYSEMTSSKQSKEENFTPKIIKDYNGNIAVFEEDKATPIKILETQTSALPIETANRLKSGIIASTKEEYLSYLEDFS